jgi:hypothetical protein
VPFKLLIASLGLLSGAACAMSLNETSAGDFSGDRLAPTRFVLDYAAGTPGHNVLSGRTGRGAQGVDRDYLQVVVPHGYRWTQLRVGQQTFSGGANGAFIGLARGATMPLEPNVQSAVGLLGWRHYAPADRGTDILDDMSRPANGSSGFSGALPAGDYTLWIQELAPGEFDYRFNLLLSPVPEPATALMLLAGLAALRRRARTPMVPPWATRSSA